MHFHFEYYFKGLFNANVFRSQRPHSMKWILIVNFMLKGYLMWKFLEHKNHTLIDIINFPKLAYCRLCTNLKYLHLRFELHMLKWESVKYESLNCHGNYHCVGPTCVPLPQYLFDLSISLIYSFMFTLIMSMYLNIPSVWLGNVIVILIKYWIGNIID